MSIGMATKGVISLIETTMFIDCDQGITIDDDAIEVTVED